MINPSPHFITNSRENIPIYMYVLNWFEVCCILPASPFVIIVLQFSAIIQRSLLGVSFYLVEYFCFCQLCSYSHLLHAVEKHHKPLSVWQVLFITCFLITFCSCILCTNLVSTEIHSFLLLFALPKTSDSASTYPFLTIIIIVSHMSSTSVYLTLFYFFISLHNCAYLQVLETCFAASNKSPSIDDPLLF